MIKLEKYNGPRSRFTCPACGKAREFTRYIDTETGEYVHHTVGKCNREVKCGYHYKPRDYFRENGLINEKRKVKSEKWEASATRNLSNTSPGKSNISIDEQVTGVTGVTKVTKAPQSLSPPAAQSLCNSESEKGKMNSEKSLSHSVTQSLCNSERSEKSLSPSVSQSLSPPAAQSLCNSVTPSLCNFVPLSPIPPVSYLRDEDVDATLRSPGSNHFLNWLLNLFPTEKVLDLADLYCIGTSMHHGGGTTIFYQVDRMGRVRSGKLIHYNPLTGHRDKRFGTTWVHAIEPHYRRSGYRLQQVLFGEHLLPYKPHSGVALVESEKTAVIAAGLMPDYLWLATGSLNEFKPAKLAVLHDRKVIAYPDLGAYDRWVSAAARLPFVVQVSPILEINASDKDRKEGLDIGDYLLNFVQQVVE